MSTKKRAMLAIVVGALCSLTAMHSVAGQWSGRNAIRKLTVQDDQTVLVFSESGAWGNPDLCDNDSRVVLLAPGEEGAALAYKEVYASILGAHLTNREVNAFVDGCTLIGNRTYPILTRVAVF